MPVNSTKNNEEQKLLDVITNSDRFTARFGYSDSYRSDEEVEKIKKAASASPDPIAFLLSKVKKYEPKYQMWSPGTVVSPGASYDLPPPNIKLSKAAKTYIPGPKEKARAKALQDKISLHNAKIAELKKLQRAEALVASAAKKEHAGLIKRIDDLTLKYFTYIEENCSEYLKSVDATHKFLYRGQSDSSLPIFVGYPRTRRKPKDSKPHIQKTFDQYLTLMGFSALRSNSIFTTSNVVQARNYGKLYAVFPKDGFKFTWSTKEADLVLSNTANLTSDDSYYESEIYNYADYVNIIDDIAKEFYFVNKEAKKWSEAIALTKAVLKWKKLDKYSERKRKVLTIFIEVATAFVAFCKVSSNFKKLSYHYAEIVQKLKAAKSELVSEDDEPKGKAAKMIKKFGLMNTNLNAAIKSGHEVCILGEYIAVDYKKYKTELDLFFLNKKAKS